MLKKFAIHAQVEAFDAAEAVHKIEALMVQKELKDVFRLAEVTPELPAMIVGYIENDIPMYTLAFRNSIDGRLKAELCFELMARCLDMIEAVDDDTFEEMVEMAMAAGVVTKDKKILYMQPSNSMDDIAEIADMMQGLEEINADSGVDEI